MSALYIIAGSYHFINPKFYLKITPKWVQKPELINQIVGTIEIILGIGFLFNSTRHYAALGIIALLVAVFPANIYHFQKSLKKGKHIIPTFIRLPIQALLIYWAFTFV
jgi:uncharacterized membrane protein